MAKGKKTGGKDFQPGKSGNPNGRPALPADVKALRTLNQVGFVRLANKYGVMTVAELEDVIADPGARAIDLAMARQFKAAAGGALGSFEFLLGRMIGKAPDEPLKSDEERRLLEMSDDELVAEAKEAARILMLEAKT